MTRSRYLLAAAVLLLAGACGIRLDRGTSTIGGSVELGRVLDEAAFYDAAAGTAAGDGPLLATAALDSFDFLGLNEDVVEGSVTPVGQLGELQVATWQTNDPEDGTLDCFGYRMGDGSGGAECGPPALGTPSSVYFELQCDGDEPARWTAFTVAEDIVALRLEIGAAPTVTGHDPEGVGLVAVEADGEVGRITAQTQAGEVRLVDAVAGCGGE